MMSPRGHHLPPVMVDDELRKRLEKLSRAYDLTTMKIFMTVEGLNEGNVYSTYEPEEHPVEENANVYSTYNLVPCGFDSRLRAKLENLSRPCSLTTMIITMTTEALGEEIYCSYDMDKKAKWEQFLLRREACRLDFTRHDNARDMYQKFLTMVDREEQGKQFHLSMMTLLKQKGASDIFPHGLSHREPENSFCNHLCKLFDKKLEAWFDTFEAVNIRLTAHVKVSNFVRVLSGQIDLLCKKNGIFFAVNVKVTGMPTPRPMDVNELCLVKAMVIQNGLAPPDAVVCGLLVCHLGDDRPVLRLWEYRPTPEMDRAIRMADIDNMIDAGKLSQFHEMWRANVCQPRVESRTARATVEDINYINGDHDPIVTNNKFSYGHDNHIDDLRR